jgi:hypothetical protein
VSNKPDSRYDDVQPKNQRLRCTLCHSILHDPQATSQNGIDDKTNDEQVKNSLVRKMIYQFLGRAPKVCDPYILRNTRCMTQVQYQTFIC